MGDQVDIEAAATLRRIADIIEGRASIASGEDEATYRCAKCQDTHFITYEKHPPGYPEGFMCTFSHPCVACPGGRRLLEASYGEPDTLESPGKKSSPQRLGVF